MSIGSIRLITTQKVLKTLSVKGMKQYYLGRNQIVAQEKIRNDLQNSSPTGSIPKFVSTNFNFYVLLGVERRLWMMMSRPSHGIPNTMLTCCGMIVIDLCCERCN